MMLARGKRNIGDFSEFLFLCASVLCFVGEAYPCPDIDGLLDLNCDQQLRIDAFGDSITKGVGDSSDKGYPGWLEEQFPHAVVRNLGKPGEDTYRGRSRAASEFSKHDDADFIVILEGVNDYWLSSPNASNSRSNLRNMVSSGEDTGAITLLAKLTPIRRSFQESWVRAVNNAIDPYTSVDFFSLGKSIISSDLLHPDRRGYQSMAELVADVLVEQSDVNRPVDSDGDGIYDFAEDEIFDTDKNNPDTDGDGLPDSEIFTYNSSPTNVDTDSDGFEDGFEVNSLGSDPSDPTPAAPVIESLEIVE